MTVMLSWSLESRWAKSSILNDSKHPKQLVSKVYCQINTILYDILSQPVIIKDNLII